MTFFQIVWLAIGLAMDATAVAAARGVAVRRVLPRQVMAVALYFGGSQALMPLLGWWIGSRIDHALLAWDHWIAFVLLSALGVKMLWDARHEGEEAIADDHHLFDFKVMSVLAFATSVDALAVGVTLPMLNAPLLLSVATIGVTTAVLSALGLFAGRYFGALLGKRLDVAGGLILIALGTKLLWEHLSRAGTGP